MLIFSKYNIMLIRRLCSISIFFVFLPSLLLGQEIKIADSITWKQCVASVNPISGKSTLYLYFDGAVFNNSSELPYYQTKVLLNSTDDANFDIKINNVKFEAIPTSHLSAITVDTLIADSVIVNQSIVTEKKIQYLLVSFIPLRKSTLSGELERLHSFSITLSKNLKHATLKSTNAENVYASTSLLSSGDWYKFTVSKSGIYKITFAEMKSLGLSNPENARIYGNGGKSLPEIYTGYVPDDMVEMPIMINNTTNGTYSDNDYILFYAQGPVTWSYDANAKKYNHNINAFTDNALYFITSNQGGKKIELIASPIGNSTNSVNSFDGLEFHEANLFNFKHSGREWYGELFDTQTNYDFTFTFPNLIANEPIYIDGEVLNRAETNTAFVINQNNKLVGNVIMSGISTGYLSDYAAAKRFQFNFVPESDNFTIKLKFDKKGSSIAQGWLNYFRLAARQNLSMGSSQLFYRDAKSVGVGKISTFTVANAPTGTAVWDITDINNVKQLAVSYGNGALSYNAASDKLREYVAFDPKSGLTPTFIKGKVINQNIHGIADVDYVIISHPDFLKQANELADIHRVHDNLSSAIVTPEQIYNEFSSGMPDPAALRNFLKLLYDKAEPSDKAPKYLLLLGDGSYNNKDKVIGGIANSNFILTYQGVNSLSATNSYVTDDYYGMLDNNESVSSGMLDVGVGRFPVKDALHAQIIVDKIKSYISAKKMGDWRNTICFIGDDEDGNIHMRQADNLASYLEKQYPSFNTEKIYLDAYKQVSTSSGSRYPDVNAAITNQINKGTLIINYTGHGGPSGVTHEQVIRQNEDINQWTNNIYPLFITATCDFAPFDDFEKTSAGEDVLLNQHGGGIGLLTTTRVVYSGPNFDLNEQFYKKGFIKSADNPAYRLGDIFRITKNNAGDSDNKLNFTLLADPALSLAIPQYRIVTDSINHFSSAKGDTLRAYGEVVVKGKIVDELGNKLENFNGVLYPTVFDKKKEILTLNNDGEGVFAFELQNNVLFKGKATVKNGDFEAQLIMPRDMDYAYGKGKISFYAADSTSDAAGTTQSVVIGGLTTGVTPNDIGPSIKLFLNDTTFLDGGISNEFPTLLAHIGDENGLNPGGNGLGHDITAILDNDLNQTFVLNSYFETNIDNFRKGSVEFKFPKISPGDHTVTFKIWDNFNNSSEAEINFKVLGGTDILLQRVYNYPNPANDYTNFFFEHNQTDAELDVTIEIYSMAGSLITRISEHIVPTGYTSTPIHWNLTSQNNNKIRPGIYLYRVIVRSSNNTSVSSSNKLVINY